MRWFKRILIGLAALVALLLCAGIALWIWKPWVPAIERVDPAPKGKRVDGGGVIANFYPAAGPGSHPGVLLLGGSEGGIGKGVTRMATGLQAEGFSVLVAAWYRLPGQRPDIDAVPLELPAKALDKLAQMPGVAADKLAVVGASKGAELALLFATRQGPRVKAVVAGMPSSVAWQGMSWEGRDTGGSWSEGGKALPYVPYPEGAGGFDIGKVYREGLRTVARHPEAVIPVERIAAPVLLVCGEADTLWPSCPMARAAAARGLSAGKQVAVLAYPDAGHAVFGLPLADDDTSGLDGLGGTNAGNNAARKDGWPKVLAFLHAALR